MFCLNLMNNKKKNLLKIQKKKLVQLISFVEHKQSFIAFPVYNLISFSKFVSKDSMNSFQTKKKTMIFYHAKPETL